MELINKFSGLFRILGSLAKIVVVVAGLAVAYYFVLALPAHNKAQLAFEKQKYLELQQADCSKIYGRLNGEFNNVDSTYFSQSTNTCMVKYFNSSKAIEETPADNFRAIK